MINKADPFYSRTYTCPICKTDFKTTAVKSSAARVLVRETDYHFRYSGVSPLHYSIIVCPFCHYAASNNSFNEIIPDQLASQVALALHTLQKEEPDFTGERELPVVLRAFQLAIQSAQLRKAPAGQVAGYVLGAAWIAREMGDRTLEFSYLQEAEKQYEQAYLNERLPVGTLDEVSMAYLIGEICRRIGRYKEAVAWFSRALSSRKGSTSPAMEKMIRDQWSQTRADAAAHPEGLAALDEQAEEVPLAAQAAPSAMKKHEEPVAASASRRRVKVTMNLHLYQDQVEWVTRLVNAVYDQSQKLTREEVVRAVIDAVMASVKPEDMAGQGAMNEAALTERLRQLLRE